MWVYHLISARAFSLSRENKNISRPDPRSDWPRAYPEGRQLVLSVYY